MRTRPFGVVLAMLLASAAAPVPADTEDCPAYCTRIEADCSRSVRAVKRDCARSAATGGVDPFTQRRSDAASLCGWFSGNHCEIHWAGPNCVRRYRERFGLCINAYTSNTAAEYLACGAGEREALGLCRAELADCQAGCD